LHTKLYTKCKAAEGNWGIRILWRRNV